MSDAGEMMDKIMPVLCTYNHDALDNDNCDGRERQCGFCCAEASRIVNVLLGIETNEPTAVEIKMMGAKKQALSPTSLSG